MTLRKIAISASVVALLGGSPAHSATTLSFASWIPWTHALSENLYIKWAETVEKASNGEIKIRRLPKGIGHPRAYLDAVRTGQIDLGFGTHGYSPRRFAAYHFTEFPFLGDRATSTSVALQRTYAKFFASKDYYKGTKLIGVNMLGPGVLLHAKKLIRTLADMKGQKIRTGGPISRRIIVGLGGISVAQPITKAYELLSSGVVDGNAGHWEQMIGFKLVKLLPYATEVPGGLNSASMYMVMNQKKYDSLSPAGKKAVDTYSGEAFAMMGGQAWDKINDDGKADAVKNGNKIIIAPKPVVDAIAKLNVEFEKEYVATAKKLGVNGRAVLDYFHGEVKKLDGK